MAHELQADLLHLPSHGHALPPLHSEGRRQPHTMHSREEMHIAHHDEAESRAAQLVNCTTTSGPSGVGHSQQRHERMDAVTVSVAR